MWLMPHHERLSAMSLDNLFAVAQEEEGVRIIKGKFNATNAAMLKTMCDRILSVAPKCVAVLFGVDGDKGSLAVVCGKEAQGKGMHAGKLIRDIAALVDGKGGGKPERAMAGVGDINKIDAALEKAPELIKAHLA